MRLRAAAPVVALALLAFSRPAFADITPPSPSPCPSAAPTPAPSGSGDQVCADIATQQLIAQVRERLGTNLADALAAEQQLQKAVDDNRQQQAQLAAQVEHADQRLVELAGLVRDMQSKVAATRARVQEERQELRLLARALYFEPGSLLLMFGEASSLGELLTRIGDLSAASARARALKSSLDQDLKDVSAEAAEEQTALSEEQGIRDGLAQSLGTLQQLQAQEAASEAALESKVSQIRAEIAGVDSQSAQLAQQIEAVLEAQLVSIIGQAMSAVWAQEQAWEQSQGSVVIPPSPGHSTKYRFIWPEPNAVVSQGFGPSTYWFEPPYQSYPHFHTGLDLVEPEGSPVYAADDGIVSAIGDGQYGYGHYVVIEHQGGFTTLYGHLLDDPARLAMLPPLNLKVGDRVTQGEVIGYEGSTGNSTGPHLHFELRINGQVQDPTPYLPPGAPSSYRQ